MSTAIKKSLVYIQLQHDSHPKNGYYLTHNPGSVSPHTPPLLHLVESLELADYWHVKLTEDVFGDSIGSISCQTQDYEPEYSSHINWYLQGVPGDHFSDGDISFGAVLSESTVYDLVIHPSDDGSDIVSIFLNDEKYSVYNFGVDKKMDSFKFTLTDFRWKFIPV